MGPLLFLIYINDLASVSSKLLPYLYADDCNVFLNGKNIEEVIHTMKSELINLNHWLTVNKLSLNVEKTNYMIFTRKKIPLLLNQVFINNIPINRVHNLKFLGVILDSKINWSNHIQYIKSKISKSLGIISKCGRFLNVSTLIKLYYAFVYPYLLYCIVVWRSASNCFMSSLEKQQKKCITSSSPRDHTSPLFRSLCFLN